MRSVVKDMTALHIDHSDQPCLIVHDLKLGAVEGAIALWIGSNTGGYFRNLKITN
jgi:hypothetical protein